jgi:PAS domain S-box-containing protein
MGARRAELGEWSSLGIEPEPNYGVWLVTAAVKADIPLEQVTVPLKSRPLKANWSCAIAVDSHAFTRSLVRNRLKDQRCETPELFLATPCKPKPMKPVKPVRTAQPAAEVHLSIDLLEALPDAVVAVDQHGTIVQVNSQAQALFGYERSEMVGQKVEMLVPEGDRGQHHHHRETYSKTPKTRRMGANLDLSGRRRDGSEFPVEISLSPVATDKGTLVLSAIRDMSDRKKIAEELRRVNEELHRRSAEQLGEYQSRLLSIIDSSEDAILSKDLKGVITSWNKGAEHIYGYPPEDVIGKNISLLIPSDRPNEIPEILRRIAQGENVEHHESVRIAKDGRRLDVFVSVSPLRDAAGAIVGASAIARDITAQKRAESQLRQSQKMEAIGRLAGGVAHDFNNILGIINACAEFLRDRIDSASEPSLYVENIRKAIERGRSLTKQMLAFSRTSSIQPRVFDVNERLRDISKLLRPLMGDDVEILIVPKSTSAIVEADPGQFDQVVVNLAVNARDAMPRGGKLILETSLIQFDETFTDRQQSMAAGNYVLLAVSDTGTGMDAVTVSRIFEPFFTTKEPGKGTGLGLATVYGIVKQSGGNILVYSEPGQGSTFKIYFPNAEHKIGVGSKAEIETVSPKRQGATILLVEDDDIMRGLTRQLLVEHGYTVVEADDGRSALEWVEAHPESVDLVLTDVVMRRMSGPDLVDRLSAQNPALKVVFMSGYTGELMANREVLKPGVTLLEKPFSRAALLNAIHATLG